MACVLAEHGVVMPAAEVLPGKEEQEPEEEAAGQQQQQQQQAPKAKRSLLSAVHFSARHNGVKPSPRILPAWV